MGLFGSFGEVLQRNVYDPMKKVTGLEETEIPAAYKPNEEAFKDTAAQKSYTQYLQNQYQGKSGPSVAENLLSAQTQKTNEQLAGAIGSTRGVQNPALLAREAARIAATQAQGAAGQGAALRAQETLGAQEAYADQLARQQTNLMNLEAMKGNIAAGQQQMAFQAAEGASGRRQQLLAGMGAGAATIGAAKSDIRVKKNIEPATAQAKDYLDFQYRKMLDQVDPYTYDYKSDEYGRGKQLGVMAQDLEKSPLGKGMVKTKDGKKEINANISTILAGQAVLNDRLNKIEGNKMQNEKDYLTYYQSPEYDPNAPTSGPFTLEEMEMSGRLPQQRRPVGQQRSPDISGVAPSRGATFDGSRPLNTMNYPALENPPVRMPDYPLENPPVQMKPTPERKLPTSQEIDAMAEDARIKKASYLMDVYNSVSNAARPMGPTPQYRPTKIENFEQYRPTRRR